MRSVSLLAVVTLHVCDYELNLECLLKHRVLLYFFLYCQLKFDSPGVRLSPDKGSVKQLDSFETFDVSEAKGQKLGTLKFNGDPGRTLVSVALSAMVK